jgi:hypothetical protein
MKGIVRLNRAIAIAVFSLAAVSAFAQSEPTKSQYEVYSAFLRIQLLDRSGIADALRVGDGGSAIAKDIVAFKKRLTKQRLSEIKALLEGLESDTLDSLAECTSKSYRLARKFTVPTEYVLVDPAGAAGRYGYIQFSCVGMNRLETQAVFYVSRLKGEYAVGKWVLMQRDSDGHWTVSKESIDWIS